MAILLDNKIALITGAGKGIGRAIAERFLKEGAIVYANDINEAELAWCSDNECRDRLHKVPFDICDFSEAKSCIMRIKKDCGRIDVLVNNAGIVSYEFISMIDYDRLRKMFEVNVLALINLTQLAARVMMRQKSGSIINMASMVGVKGAKGQLSYSATKGAVVSVTRSASKELAEYGIRVNAVAPGMVATERFKSVIENKFENRIEDIGFGRMATPDEIADAYVFLASDMSKYITGQILGVDGGFIL